LVHEGAVIVGVEINLKGVATGGQTGQVMPSAIEAANFLAVDVEVGVTFAGETAEADAFRGKAKVFDL